ncbi:MAG: hypothetical protein J1E83_07810 [Lachnospiraceae bacterium]|nr:hypothetical protein [Lachnospiraceae bacterium]
MGKIRERVIAYVLAFCTLVSAVCTGITMPVSAAEGTGNIELNTSTVQIWDGQKWVDFTDGMTVRDGDSLSITFNWSLDNTDKETKEFRSKITPLENVTIPNMPEPLPLMYGNTPIGTYQVVNGELIIIITDDEYLENHSERKGGVNVTGQIAVNGGPEKDGEKVPIVIVDQTINANYKSTAAESGLWISKNADGGVVKGEDGKYRQAFKVSLTAHDGDVTINELKDELGNGLSNMSEWKVIECPSGNEALSQALAGGVFSLNDLNDALKGKTLSKGETLTFEYTVEVSEDIYKQDGGGKNYSNAFSADYTTNGNNQTSNGDSASASANRPTVEKKGVIKGDDQLVEWTITIDLKDWKDKSIDEIIDELGSGFVEENISISKDDFDETPDGSGIWVATYTTHISEDVQNSPSTTQLKNKVTVTVGGNEYTAEGSVASKETTWIEKVATGYDPDTNRITWEVILLVPDTEVTNVRVSDVPNASALGRHTLQTDAVWVDGELVVDKGQKVASNDIITEYNNYYGIYIVFNDAYIQKHAGESIKITYTTLVEDDVNTGNSYRNDATLTYFDSTVGDTGKDVQQSTSATWKHESERDVLSKEGEPAKNGENAIDYTLEINIDDIQGLEEGGEIVVTDVLPDGLKLVEDSIKYINIEYYPSWNVKQEYQSAEKISGSNEGTEGTIEFKIPVTSSVISNKNNLDEWGVYYIRITFTAEVIDQSTFTRNGGASYTNTATATYNMKNIGSAETTTELTPKQVVTKKADYSEATAPYVYYTIDVNPDALDLSDGWLLAKDTLGSALSYDLSTIKVEEYTAEGIWKDLIKGTDYMYTYDASDNSVTFQLPDQKHLRITYTVLVNLSYSTDETKNGQLTPENSFNRFQLTAFQSSSMEAESNFDQAVFQPRGWAEATLGRVTINKYYTSEDGQMIDLDGAVFKLSAVVNNDTTSDPMQLNPVEASIEVKDGKATISGLSLDQIYVLEEITAPTGYKRGEPFYFVLPGSSNVTLPDGLNGITCASEGTIYYENFPKTTADGQLVITKTVTGDVSKETAEQFLQFTVTKKGASGDSIVYQNYLSDFSYDGGSWTKELELEPGEYTVEETLYDIEGKVITSVTYTVSSVGGETALVENGEPVPGANPPTVTVTENGSITVAYKDNYEDEIIAPTLGSLTIKKTVTGALNWSDVVGEISFTVKKGDKVIGTYTYTASEIDPASGLYSHTISDLEPGEYTVTETVTDKAGYTCSTTYTVTVSKDGEPQESVPQTEAKVEVTAGEETTVHFVNTYKREVGSLTLEKTIAGGLSWDAIKAGLTFVISVKGTDGTYTEYTKIYGSQLNPSEGKYSFTLDNLPTGEYKVEEIVSGNIAWGGKDYVLATVTYQVGGSRETDCTTDKSTSDITIGKGENTRVTFNNTYALNEGKLILRKKVEGIQNGEQAADAQAAWEAVKGSLTFEVSKYNDEAAPPGYEFYESISGNDGRWKMEGEYAVLELTGLPVGTYKVEETSGLLEDYTIVATVCEVSPANGGSIAEDKLSAENIEVKREGAKDTVTVTVTFTNTYISNNAQIQLEKKIEGVLNKKGNPLSTKDVWETIKEQLKFEITNEDTGATTTVDGSGDWKYNEESDSYIITVPLTAGTYTVKETVFDVTDHTWKSVSYTVTVGGSTSENGTIADAENAETPSFEVKPGSSNIIVSLCNNYEHDEGTLKLTKEVTGLSADVLQTLINNKKIEFTIVNVDTGKAYPFTLSDFKDNEDGTYTLMFDGKSGNQEMLPTGTYTITESDFNIDNYSVEVTYEVNPPEARTEEAQGPEGPGKTVYFIVKKDGETEVTFTNNYTKDPGKLTLQKTVSGDLDWDDVKGTFSIVIDYEGSGSDPKFPMTIEGKDSRWTVSSENVYTLTLEGLEPREYTVTETFKDEKTGYTRTTTYKVNGNSAEADSEGKVKVTVTSNTTGKVDIENNYSQDKGKLIITKTIVGLDEDADAKNTVVSTIKFVVTNADTKKKVGEYSLSTFGENSGLYTMEIPELPVGNYTVEETAYTVEGYIISSITYTVNNNGETTLVTNEGEPGAAPAVVIEKGESTTIAFKDTYTKKLPDTGKLILQKIVGGELNYERWNDIKATLSFEVKDSQGKEVEGSPFAASGFTYNDNYKAYVLEIPNLTPGEYTVRELINGKVTDYTCSTTYTVGSGATAGLPYEEAGVKVNVPANGDNQVVFTNRYTLDRGNLKITKTIEGDVTKEQAKAITFTITNGKDYTKEFTLANGEFNYDEPSKTYTLSLENLPVGNYTVTETHYNMDGFITESITYQINGNGEVELVKNDKPTGQAAPTATVEKGQTATIAYKDVYRAIPKGSLDLEKTVTGNLKWADVKDHISFTVKGPGGYEKTFTAKDFKDEDGDGIYTCTISDLELGTYTITETVTQEEKGYTRTTRYVVGSENAKEGGSAELELTEANPDGKVTFSNDYVQNKGSLQLTKVVTGLSADELNAAIKAGKIKFVIKNKETGIEYPYTLANFASNGSGSYTLIFDGEGTNPGMLPEGEYTIIESNFDIPNYQLGITYVVKGGASGSGNEVSITVKKDTRTEVTINNMYTSTKGSLVIQKRVTREDPNDPVIGWSDIKKYLSFVIKDEDGKVVRTISPNEVNFEELNGTYSYTVTGLDAGKTYTVTETSSKVPGYSYTVSFTGEGNVTPLSGNGAETKATVSEAESAVITFTNTYKKDKEEQQKPTQPPETNPTPSTPNPAPAPTQPTPTPSPTPVLQVPPTPSPSKSPGEGGNVLGAERDRVPQTSDYFFMWLSLFLASLSSLLGYLSFLNKKNRDS